MTQRFSFQWIQVRNFLATLLAPPVVLPVVALSIVLPTASFAQAEGAGQDVPRFEPSPCSYDLPAEVVDNGQAHCGFLIVPVRHTNPQGPVLRLAVLILDARNPSDPASPPLIILHGGPGGSAIANAYTFASSPLRDQSDLILFDQRGAGYSGPALACPEVIDTWFDDSIEELTAEQQNEAYLASHRECSQRLKAEGFDVGAYTTRENAGDVEDLRRAMGFDKVNLYGVSYGAELALAVMSAYPNGLHSVILDSPVPPYGGTYETERAAVDALVATCERDPECRRAYPELAAEFERVFSALNDQPIPISASNPRSGEIISWEMDGSYLASLVGESLRASYAVPLVPLIIHDAADGKFALIELITEILLAFVEDHSWGTNYAVNCGSFETAFTSTYPDSLSFENGESLSPRTPPEECVFWSSPEETAGTSQASALEPPSAPIPALILAGAFDPLTTPDYSLWLADQLPDATALTIANAGHGAIASSNCADILMRDFLASPAQAPFPDCLRGLGKIDFVTDDELVRMPFVEVGLGIARRSPLTIRALVVLGAAGLMVLVSALVTAIERLSPLSIRKWWRARRLARRWEALHPPQRSKFTSGRLILALAILSIGSPCPLLFLPTELAFLLWASPLCALLVLVLIGMKSAHKSKRRKQLYRRWRKMYAPLNAGSSSVNSIRFAFMLIALAVLVAAMIFWGLILDDYSAIFGLPKSAWFLWVVVAVTIVMGLLTMRDGALAVGYAQGSAFRKVLQVITSVAAATIVISMSTLLVRGVLQ